MKYFFILIIILSFPLTSWSQTENQPTRRAFLGLSGGGVAVAAVPSATFSALAQQRTINMGYIDILRTMLIRNRQIGDAIGPRPPLHLARPAVVKYYRGLINALAQDGVSPSEVRHIENMRTEFRIYFPNADQELREMSERHQTTNNFSFLFEILEARTMLGVDLLTRLQWQLQNPTENVLVRNSSTNELLALEGYRRFLNAYSEVLAESNIRVPEGSQQRLNQWVLEINQIFEVETVDRWYQQHLRQQVRSCNRVFSF
ncbi:MAG: hypothetical protein HRT44_11740 [Bdellovibrionales bacterium]|nr:hypothetical protein [Bdellovibrionales bacterium]NQZ19911.1 hypothetical protein [Bdellovibrionales bacterium]